MSAIRSVDNKTELALRRALHALGLRYRKHPQSLTGKPDIVFPSAKLAVFVDGDYWHGRLLKESGPDAVHDYYTEGQRNYWVEKLQRNVSRDEYVTRVLSEAGWLVRRYWESDVRRNLEGTANEIRDLVTRRRTKLDDTK